MATFIRPSFEIWAASGHPELPYQYENWHKLIEAAGRVCYKSEDKITKDSAWPFLERLWKKKHYSVFEHSWFTGVLLYDEIFPSAASTKFLEIVNLWEDEYVLAGNLRAFTEAFSDRPGGKRKFKAPFFETDDIPSAHHYPELYAMTVKIVTNRAITHELVRHRIASYSQESTRYCNYKNKGITFIIPPWIETIEGYDSIESDSNFTFASHFPALRPERNDMERHATATWLTAMDSAEDAYDMLINYGQRPEQARGVLPNDLKTEIVVTASLKEWQHIFKLRCSPAAHPQIREIMIPLRKEANELFKGVFNES